MFVFVFQGAVISVVFSRTGDLFASGGADSQVGVSTDRQLLLLFAEESLESLCDRSCTYKPTGVNVEDKLRHQVLPGRPAAAQPKIHPRSPAPCV